MDDLIRLSACEVVDCLRGEEVSPLELLDVVEARVSAVDHLVNALPTLCFERARDRASALMKRPVSERGLLGGLPVVIKDLEAVSGVRCTLGSAVFSDFVPVASDIVVESVEGRGGVVFAKSNTPEFGAGANTFNEVFGATVNPWDTRLSCAGSSGGSAVALATGMGWLASGSDLGGSLRNPASFCSVVGLRPSPGRVARGGAGPGAYPAGLGGMSTDPFSVVGPMARNVADVALFLDALVGEHVGDGLSLPFDGVCYLDAVRGRRLPRKVAVSLDFGFSPVDARVARVVENAARVFEDLGCEVVWDHPDFSGVEDVFRTNRALSFYVGLGGLYEERRGDLKPEVQWNIELGAAVSAADIRRVEALRGALLARVGAFFGEYDLLVSPATIVPPFPVGERFVRACNGVEFDNYIQWCGIAYALSVVGLPAVSVPGGFIDDGSDADGLPVGVQLVGGPRGEADLLAAAGLFEEAVGVAGRVPLEPRVR